jgi:hypothetical protein
MVETHETDRTAPLLAALRDPEYCLRGNGGAGRVLWAYPRPAREREFTDRIRELSRGFADVIPADELFDSGAIEGSPIARTRIGRTLVIASGTEFPVLDAEHRFEHGGLSEVEMLVPVAVWQGH